MSVYLRTITMARSPMSLTPGAAQRDKPGSDAFWDSIASRVDGGDPGGAGNVVVEHARRSQGEGHYLTLSEDSLETPLHVFTIRQTGPLAVLGLPEGCAIKEMELRFHDHNVLMMELCIDITAYLGDRPLRRGDARDLEGLAHQAGLRSCRYIEAAWLSSLRATVQSIDRDEDFVRFADGGGIEMMWTARALFADTASERGLGLAPAWLDDAGASREEIDEIMTGQREYFCAWLNYLFLSPDPESAAMLRREEDGVEVWAGLRHAQYFYAALELVDVRLSEVLAQTHTTLSGVDLAMLREELTSASHAADLIVMQRQETEKYLRRSVHAHMREILDGWQTAELVERPVRQKAALCAQRVSAISDDLARRAGVWTDLILLGIAVTSILGTALSVVAFGRTLGSDALMAGYDSGNSGIIEFLASQPADAVLLTSVVISVGLALIYVMYRRSSNS